MIGLMILVNVVLGLYWSIYAFAQRIAFWNAAGAFYTLQAVVFSALSYIVSWVPYAIAGLCFLWWSGRIVDRASLAPGEGEAVDATGLRSMEISLVAVLGLYLLADGFADLFGVFAQGLSYQGGRSPSVIWIWQNAIPWIMRPLAKLALGALLVLRRGGVVAALHRVRAWVRKWRAYPGEEPLSER
jgi:hypothetical protein